MGKEKAMIEIMKQIVRDYAKRHLDKTDGEQDFDVYVVWQCKALQNWKALLSTSLPDGMYYELTYNGDKKEMYVDAYKKFENFTVKRGDNYMNFGQAIETLKQGKKVARAGWNGKNQYVELATSISYKNANGEIINCEHEAIGNNALAFVGTSGVQMGWLASQADMLAEDWIVL